MALPLEGIRILDFSIMMQGPYGSQMLGDMGAEVIKVEPPGTGERGRASGVEFFKGEGAYFLAMNRNKKSITVNLKSEKGKEIVFKLAERCDVVLQNFRPGVMARLGLDYEAFARVNPRIIYCSASGYGQSGPYRTKPGQDLIIQGIGGMMSLTGAKDHPPMPAGTFIADVHAATLVAYGIMLALFHRERTGEGQHLEVCLLDALLDMHSQEATTYLNSGLYPHRGAPGIGHVYGTPPYGVYKTQDRYITLVGPLSKICKVLDVEDFEAKYSTPRERYEHREEIHACLESVLIQRPSAEWLALFEAEDIWCGPVNTYDQVFTDPQVSHNEMVVEYEHPVAGKIKVTGIPVKLSKTPGQIRRPPPLLGEHTDEILAESGYTQEEIAEFRAAGII